MDYARADLPVGAPPPLALSTGNLAGQFFRCGLGARATFPTGRQPRVEVRRRWNEESAGTRNMMIVVVKRMPQPIEAAKGTKNCA